jgi:hypothetical protein
MVNEDPTGPGQAAQGLALAAEVEARPGPPGSLSPGPAAAPPPPRGRIGPARPRPTSCAAPESRRPAGCRRSSVHRTRNVRRSPEPDRGGPPGPSEGFVSREEGASAEAQGRAPVAVPTLHKDQVVRRPAGGVQQGRAGRMAKAQPQGPAPRGRRPRPGPGRQSRRPRPRPCPGRCGEAGPCAPKAGPPRPSSQASGDSRPKADGESGAAAQGGSDRLEADIAAACARMLARRARPVPLKPERPSARGRSQQEDDAWAWKP